MRRNDAGHTNLHELVANACGWLALAITCAVRWRTSGSAPFRFPVSAGEAASKDVQAMKRFAADKDYAFGSSMPSKR
jgi:hypothetical protein